jgi:hypothetical protein
MAAPDFANNMDYRTYDETGADADAEAGLVALFTTATNAVNLPRTYPDSLCTSDGVGFAARRRIGGTPSTSSTWPQAPKQEAVRISPVSPMHPRCRTS